MTKGVLGVPRIFTHSIASTIFHLWDMLGRSHPPLQDSNTHYRGLPLQCRGLPTLGRTWKVLGYYFLRVLLPLVPATLLRRSLGILLAHMPSLFSLGTSDFSSLPLLVFLLVLPSLPAFPWRVCHPYLLKSL